MVHIVYNMKTLITARIDSADAAKLQKIAVRKKRSISWLVAEAVKLFLKGKRA